MVNGSSRSSAARIWPGAPARSDIYARPDLYDMEHEGASHQDARFFARLLARVRPRRVLELACGSGRVTFPLAVALPKTEIVGVDASVEMLGKAAEARNAAPSSVRPRTSFMTGDMRDWPGSGDPFDAVVIAVVRCRIYSRSTIDVAPGRPRFASSARAASSSSMSACLTWRRWLNPNACDHGPS